MMAGEGAKSMSACSSPLMTYAVRFCPGEEIVCGLQKLVDDNKLQASFILTCVGSVMKAKLRMANSHTINTYESGPYEIVSLVGTLSAGGHLHASFSDDKGNVFGGHVMGDLIVFTTAEVIVGDATNLKFSREFDSKSGYDELVVAGKDSS